MNTIHLTIPNMKSPHCQLTVTQIAKETGARVTSISPMKAEIELGDGVSRESVISAIEKGGYQVQPSHSCCAV